MKAVVWHDVGKISVDEVADPVLRDPADAIVRVTTVPGLLSRIATGGADPATVISQQEEMPTALEAYQAFDRREPGWTKVTLELSG